MMNVGCKKRRVKRPMEETRAMSMNWAKVIEKLFMADMESK